MIRRFFGWDSSTTVARVHSLLENLETIALVAAILFDVILDLKYAGNVAWVILAFADASQRLYGWRDKKLSELATGKLWSQLRSTEWRHLTPNQKDVICRVLGPNITSQMRIASCRSDPEAWEYAKEFADELKSCFTARGQEAPTLLSMTTVWTSPVVFGVWVRVSPHEEFDGDLKERSRVAERLRSEFEANGLKVSGITTDRANSPFEIYIGPNFPPAFGV